MKTIHLSTLWLGVALGCFGARLQAQQFDNGSTNNADVVISDNTTLDLPENGILHFGSLKVETGKTLAFRRNTLNTPVYILSRRDVLIEGTVDVSGSPSPTDAPTGGAGGPGGFDGGKPGFIDFAPGAGYGPGAGNGGTTADNPSGAGSGSYGTVAAAWQNTNKGAIYGSAFLIPLVGGSGGGGTTGSPGRGGGGGGGAILISSNTKIRITGRILALGGYNGNSSGGSGGAIRLVSPSVSGTGEVNVQTVSSWAGRGRIRVDTIDRSDLRLNFQPTEAVSAGANLFIFPQPIPRLDIVAVGTRQIPVGSGPAQVQLPFGASPNVPVTVQASGWGRRVPIRVVLTPDSGAPIQFDSEIDNTAPAVASVNVPTVFPVNTLVNVMAWTR